MERRGGKGKFVNSRGNAWVMIFLSGSWLLTGFLPRGCGVLEDWFTGNGWMEFGARSVVSVGLSGFINDDPGVWI